MMGQVFLVGAGPGDGGLMTLRGKALLDRADVVVYDALVGDEVLAMIPPAARCVNVGKRASRHTRSQEEINRILLEEALAGHTVVRLKGGDHVRIQHVVICPGHILIFHGEGFVLRGSAGEADGSLTSIFWGEIPAFRLAAKDPNIPHVNGGSGDGEMNHQRLSRTECAVRNLKSCPQVNFPGGEALLLHFSNDVIE